MKRVGTTNCYGGPYTLTWFEATSMYLEDGTYNKLTTTWTDYSKSLDTKPYTSSPWTWEDIALLRMRIKLRGYNSSSYACCSKAWIVVTYTEAITGMTRRCIIRMPFN